MKWKPVLAVLFIVLTAALFANYFRHHPELLQQVMMLGWPVLVGLLALYFLTLGPLALVLFFTLQLCGHKIAFKELLLITGYSAIVNFFGPLQSGPVFRAVYLKTKYGVSIKSYALATLLYYASLAVTSGAILFLGSRWWYLALVALVIIGLVSWWYFRRKQRQGGEVQWRWDVVGKLVLATLLQVLILAIIYFVELRVVDNAVSYNQALSYTGAANFSLFVALTPGAIGIREAFLLFSQHISQLTSATILTASLIDRAIYVGFLVLIFIVSLITHARDRFKVAEAPSPA